MRNRTVMPESLEQRVLLSSEGIEGGPGDLNDQLSEATIVSVGTSFAGTIDPADDVDMFQVTLAAFQVVGFDVDRFSGSGLDSYLRLFDAWGTELAYSDDTLAPDEPFGFDGNRGSYIEFRNPNAVATTYYVGISAYNNSTYDPITGTGDVNGGTTGGYYFAITNRFAALNSGGVVVTGTAGADTISVRRSGTDLIAIDLNGSVLNFQHARIAHVIIDGAAAGDSIESSGTFKPTTILGGTGDDTIIVSGTSPNTMIRVEPGAGTDLLMVDESGYSLPAAFLYEITASSIGGPGPFDVEFVASETERLHLLGGQSTVRVNYDLFATPVAQVTVTGNGGTDRFFVYGTSPGTSVTLDGRADNNEFYVGDGDIVSNIRGALTLAGGAGTDLVHYLDQNAASGNRTYSIGVQAPQDLLITGMSSRITTNEIDQMRLDAGSDSSTFDLITWWRFSSSDYPVTLNAGAGDDVIRLDDDAVVGDYAELVANVVLDAGPGFDSVRVLNDGVASTTLEDFVLAAQTLTVRYTLASKGQTAAAPAESPMAAAGAAREGGPEAFLEPVLTFGNLESLTVLCDDAPNDVEINAPDLGQARFESGGGVDTFRVLETLIGRDLVINTGDGDDELQLNLDGAGQASARFDTFERIGLLWAGTGGKLTLTPGRASNLLITGNVLGPFTTGGATLDINDNIEIFDAGEPGELSFVRAALASGYAGGSWLGGGYTSTAAAGDGRATGIGYIVAEELFGPAGGVYAGIPVSRHAQILRYTLYGDANLDQRVTIADFNRLAANFGTGSLWSQGNFNYDSTVSLPDFNRLATNFGQIAGADADEEQWADV